MNLEYKEFGEKDKGTILIIGGIHGNEPGGRVVAKNLIDKLEEDGSGLQYKTVVVENLNPGGEKLNTRQNENVVDLNRNFPTKNWIKRDKDHYHYGGESAASEEGTKFVVELENKFKPDIVIVLHEEPPDGLYPGMEPSVNIDGTAEDIGKAISEYMNFPFKPSMGYPTPGSIGNYFGVERQRKCITVELSFQAGDEEINKMVECIKDICTSTLNYGPGPEKLSHMEYKHRTLKNAFHIAEGLLSSAYYGNPSSKLKLVGITGTAGKTTTVTVLHQLFTELGYKVGLISSIVNKIGEKEYHTELTMDRLSEVNRLMKEMVKEGCEYCFIEVTSQAIDQKRHTGFKFVGGIYTNLSQDHLDYHNTMDEYASAKKRFFDGLDSDAFALANVDDQYGPYMLENTQAKKGSYGMGEKADYKVKLLDNSASGIKIELEGREFKTNFIGKHNAYNLGAVYATAMMLGEDKEKVLDIFEKLKPVRGRTEMVLSETGVSGMVDYAHKPEALQKVLESLNETKAEGNKVISLVGCGGDRDRGKRPKMAKIGYDLSDQLILTSDNPRTEDPEEILEEMQEGIKDEENYDQVITISDRREAINKAVEIANPGDMILVAGKGHEDYQIIGTEKTHFDDLEELKKAYEKFGK